MRSAAQENLNLAQGGLNSQLQQRGQFFGTPGLQMQADLSRGVGQDLNNLIFGNAMQAIPQGLSLFGAGAGLSGMPNQMAPGTNELIQLLGQLRGSVSNPQYAPDPLTQILGAILPFISF